MNYVLRPWKGSDAESLCKYANNKHIADNLRDDFPYPYTLDDAMYFINLARNYPEDKGRIYAIEFNGEAIGNVSLERKKGVFCKSAEVGYWLGEPYWRRGIMTKVLKEVISMAFKSYDIVRVYGVVMEENIGSRRVLENVGMELEATIKKCIYKNNTFYDACVYTKFGE